MNRPKVLFGKQLRAVNVHTSRIKDNRSTTTSKKRKGHFDNKFEISCLIVTRDGLQDVIKFDYSTPRRKQLLSAKHDLIKTEVV